MENKKIKVLFDIGHPAHFHLFKNLMFHLKSKGISFVITSRNKEITNALIENEGFGHRSLSNPGGSLFSMFFEMLKRDILIYNLHRQERFTHAFGTSVSIAHLSVVSKVKSYNFCEDDDAVIPLQAKLIYPFTTQIMVPDCLQFSKWKEKRVIIPSYHELAYLHPNNFISDPGIVQNYNLQPKKYVVVRLSALKAHHDVGMKGISSELMEKIKGLLSEYEVIESSELSNQYRIKPWDMHHVLANAKMIISDSQTMTIEGAVLGVPAVRINTFIGKSTVISELEDEYKLAYGFYPDDETSILDTIKYLAHDRTIQDKWERKREKLLLEKIDLNQWMIDFFQKEIES